MSECGTLLTEEPGHLHDVLGDVGVDVPESHKYKCNYKFMIWKMKYNKCLSRFLLSITFIVESKIQGDLLSFLILHGRDSSCFSSLF